MNEKYPFLPEEDDSIEIPFVTVRYKKRDAELLKRAEENQIPVELSKNINSEEFVGRMKRDCAK